MLLSIELSLNKKTFIVRKIICYLDFILNYLYQIIIIVDMLDQFLVTIKLIFQSS